MKPDFKAMSRKELRAYVIQHPNNNEAFYAYVDKSEAEGNWVTMPPLNSMEDFDNYPEFTEALRKDGEGKKTATIESLGHKSRNRIDISSFIDLIDRDFDALPKKTIKEIVEESVKLNIEQQEVIADQQEQINNLKNRIDELENRINGLESRA